MGYIGSGPTRFNTADDLTVTDDAEIKGGLSVDGAVDLNTSLNVDGTVTADGLTVAPDANRSLNVATDGTYSLILENTSTNSSADLTFKAKDDIVIKCNDLNTFRASAGGDIFFYEDTGTTPKLFWDASAESLGIGTTSPTAPLHVGISVGSYDVTTITHAQLDDGASIILSDPSLNNQQNYTHGGIALGGYGGENNTAIMTYDDGGSGANGLSFITGNNTSISEKARIDSSGRVTMPYQPAFQIRGASSGISAGGEVYDDAGDWDTVLLDVGSNFNTSNGRFTAPVTGNYFLSAEQFCVSSTTGTYQGIRINKNGVGYGYTMYGYVQTANDETVSTTMVMPMTAGDYATVECFIGNNGTQSGNRIHFSGHLIG